MGAGAPFYEPTGQRPRRVLEPHERRPAALLRGLVHVDLHDVIVRALRLLPPARPPLLELALVLG